MGEDPYDYDPYVVDAPAPVDRGRRTLIAVIAALSVVIVAMAAGGASLLFGGSGQAEDVSVAVQEESVDTAEPAPASPEDVTPEAAQEDESEAEMLAATATSDGADGSDAADESLPSAAAVREQADSTPVAVGGPITRSEALGALNDYLARAVADPESAWFTLTDGRRAGESHASYVEWWRGLSSADIVNCHFDDALSVATCDLVTRNHRGSRAVTRDVRFPLVRQGSAILIDTVREPAPYDAASHAQLESLRQQSLAMPSIDGRWVAQLSAKANGTTDPLQLAQNGTDTFYYPDILAMHESLVHRFPADRVLMLNRVDWGRQSGGDLWFTIVDGGFASKGQVQQWCGDAFPELSGASLENMCLPRQLRPPFHS